MVKDGLTYYDVSFRNDCTSECSEDNRDELQWFFAFSFFVPHQLKCGHESIHYQ